MTDKTENTALIPVQLQVVVTPPVIERNLAPLKAALVKMIDDQSNTVITLDNVKEGKEVAAAINKTKTALASERKRVVGEASAPVKLFETEAKELEAICEEGYRKLKDQTDKFDEAKTAEHLQIIKDALAAAWEASGVEQEFRSATVEDLATLTAVTPKGSLTKATKTTLDSRVAEDKSLQDRTNMRLVMLENQSFKAGLVSPLNRSHVAAFLFAPDEAYQRMLDSMIASEVERQRQTEEATRAKVAAEQLRQQKIDEANNYLQSASNPVQEAVGEALVAQSQVVYAEAAQPQTLGAQLKVNHPAFGAEQSQSRPAPTIGQKININHQDFDPEQKDQFGAALNGVQQGKPMTCTQSEFEQHVIGLSSSADGYFEIYSRSSGLVAIVKSGVLFRKVDQ